MSLIPEDLLLKLNREFIDQNVPHRLRPFQAFRRLGLVLPSLEADYVDKWFEGRSPKGAHSIGSLFIGAYYFDCHFWKVNVPMTYGIVRINALDSLEGLPQVLRKEIEAKPELLFDYLSLWVDVMDYGYGSQEVSLTPKPSDFAVGLAKAAGIKLCATVRLLTEGQHASAGAMDSARMTTELFLKAYLAVHDNLSERDAKDMSHNLRRLATRCNDVSALKEYCQIVELCQDFPDVKSRYAGHSIEDVRLWNGYCLAQYCATAFARSCGGRDSRAQWLGIRYTGNAA